MKISVSTARRNLKKAQDAYAAADKDAQDAIDRRVDTTPSLEARGRAQRALWKAEEALEAAKL